MDRYINVLEEDILFINEHTKLYLNIELDAVMLRWRGIQPIQTFEALKGNNNVLKIKKYVYIFFFIITF